MMSWSEVLALLPARDRQFLEARARGMKLRQIAEWHGTDVRTVAEVIDRTVTQLQLYLDEIRGEDDGTKA